MTRRSAFKLLSATALLMGIANCAVPNDAPAIGCAVDPKEIGCPTYVPPNDATADAEDDGATSATGDASPEANAEAGNSDAGSSADAAGE
jgi:hypothetical protein